MSAAEHTAAERERLLTRLATSAAPRGFHLAFDLLRDRAEAEDAVQEALARACESCDQVREPEAIEGWFHRVLTHVCLRMLRRRRLRRMFLGRGPEPAQSHDSRGSEALVTPGMGPEALLGAALGASTDEPGADRALAQRQDLDRMLRCLDRLPAMQRVALLLRYGHDRSIADIAALLDVKPATVKTHLVRGLRRLRNAMEHE